MPFDDIPKPGLWKRLLIGAVLVVFAAAGATAVAAFHEVDKVVDALKINPELKLGRSLAETDPGEPQTLMILGSDKRPKDNVEGADGGARSDTIMLVRLDPDKGAIAVMSLPRDLKVQIPGHGVDKINAAYDLGGPDLTLDTVKALTGLPINHVINVDFAGFGRAVNAIGCVYADIDRTYYNDTAEYAYINVPAGYQRMCGDKALQYVRFRHEDTDLVRSARQQDFLRQAKQQVATGGADRQPRPAAAHLRQEHQHRRGAALDRRGAAAGEAGDRHRGTAAARGALRGHDRAELRRGDQRAGAEARAAVPRHRGVERPARRRRRRGRGARSAAGPPSWASSRTRRTARTRRCELCRPGRATGCRSTTRPCAPRSPTTASPRACTGSRTRTARSTRPTAWCSHAASCWARTTASRASPGRTPPILREPQEVRTIGKRTYELHYDGDRLRLVAWRTPKGAYWISNTLLLSLTNRQMMTIARSARTL